MLKKGRVVVMRPNRPIDLTDVIADDVAIRNVSETLPQHKIDEQRFASVLRDPVHTSLLTVATVASRQMP